MVLAQHAYSQRLLVVTGPVTSQAKAHGTSRMPCSAAAPHGNPRGVREGRSATNNATAHNGDRDLLTHMRCRSLLSGHVGSSSATCIT